jgi:hypothetical protein
MQFERRVGACMRSTLGPRPPQRLMLLARSRASPVQIIHLPQHSTAKQRMCMCTKSSYVASTIMCPTKQPLPQGSQSSFLNSNCRDAMTLPLQSPLRSQLAMLLVPFSCQHSHPRNHTSSSPCISVPQLVKDAPLLGPGGRSFSHVALRI